MTIGNGLENFQRFDTKCWGQGRQCENMNNTRDGEEPAYESKQDTHTEREIGTKERTIFQKATVTNDSQPTFTKGYKVTLYTN